MKKDRTWWLDIINKLITNPEKTNQLISEIQKTDTEIAEGLYNISLMLRKYYTNKSFIENIVNQINDQILQYAQNNYFYNIEPTGNDDLFDSLITALNMLGEEINFSTVSKQYFTDIFNTIPDFIIVVDKDGNIQTVNQKTLDEIGESKENVTHLNLCDLFKEKYSFEELFQSIGKERIFYFKKKNNTFIPVTIKTEKFIESDKGSTLRVFILSDMSEILKYEHKLEVALEKAKESDRLKSSFLANVSHEIRTPMNGILGFADLLKLPDLSEKERIEFLEIIEQSGNRMLETINDIIDISKIEAGQVQVNLTEVKLNKLLSEIYLFFKPEADRKEIQLSLQPTFPDNRDSIITDNRMLNGIITNLLKNALKFTAKGRIEFGYIVKGKTLEFFVKDTGIGIAEDKQKIIFNRFIQEKQGYSRQFEGSGLGLSIAKAYVDFLGGEIWLESELEKGSLFYFTIPLKFAKNTIQETTENERTESFVPQKKINILVAEDEDVTYTFLSIVLKNITNKFYRAISGKEAIEILQKNPDIDLILMDIKMPEMNGYEATREIRTFNKDVFIIAQTAYAFSDDKIKAFDAGCNDYLAKPIKKDELLSKISFLLSESYHLQISRKNDLRL